MKAFGYIDGMTGFKITRPDGTTALTVPPGAFALVNLNGNVLSLPSGELISVQPDGSVQTRPANAAGAWETGTIDGGVITYAPDPSSGLCFPFGLKDA